jgi:hypothetical protein
VLGLAGQRGVEDLADSAPAIGVEARGHTRPKRCGLYA